MKAEPCEGRLFVHPIGFHRAFIRFGHSYALPHGREIYLHPISPSSIMTTTLRKAAASSYAPLIGMNLALAREAAGLTQHELAHLAQTSRATIAQIEAGSSDPRMSTIAALALALGVTPDLLLLGEREASRLVDVLDLCHEIIDMAPNDAQTNTMTQLVESRVAKENRRGARYAADYVSARGYDGLGSRVGAAIINAHTPGIGASIGAFLFSDEEEPEEKLEDVGE